ncbi:hypothetical protein ACWCQX_45025, partial [Streptomyces sp. NPDC002346]
ASVLIFLGVWIWNDFLNPLIVLGPAAGTTVTTKKPRADGLGLLHGAGDENRTRALSLGITSGFAR